MTVQITNFSVDFLDIIDLLETTSVLKGMFIESSLL